MDYTLVSIVVLTYKKFEYLEEAIKSIWSQKFKNIELIINDDCSPNFNYKNIEDIVSKYSSRFNKILINSNSKNLGTVKNFNEAIKCSRGEIIIPLSADDVLDNDLVVQNIVNFFSNNDELICTAKRRVIDNGKILEVLPKPEQISIIKESNQALLNAICKGNFISGACTYYRRSIFEKYGLFNENYVLMEDYPFYLNLLINNEKIGYLDYITIRYRLGGVSNINNLNSIFLEDWKKCYEEIIFKNRKNLNITLYRTCKLDYYRNFFKQKKIIYYIMHLVYFDIVITKMLKKIIG